MAYYSANKPNRTVTLHKVDCHRIPSVLANGCGCGATDKNGNQRWFCEHHVTLEKIDEHMNHRHWSFLPCHDCYTD